MHLAVVRMIDLIGVLVEVSIVGQSLHLLNGALSSAKLGHYGRLMLASHSFVNAGEGLGVEANER